MPIIFLKLKDLFGIRSITDGRECNPFMDCIPRIGTVHKGTALQRLP